MIYVPLRVTFTKRLNQAKSNFRISENSENQNLSDKTTTHRILGKNPEESKKNLEPTVL